MTGEVAVQLPDRIKNKCRIDIFKLLLSLLRHRTVQIASNNIEEFISFKRTSRL